MKNKYFIYTLSFIAIIAAIFGCVKNDTLDHLNVSAVKKLYAPFDNKFLKLQPATLENVLFEWEQAKAEDGSLVIYEIAFDKVDGDFSSPVYKMPSDDNGKYNSARLTHKVLNKIAALAGIGSLSTGKLKWTVFSSKGIDAKQAAESRVIELERPAGFADIPVDLFISGDGTEAGADITKAIKMKKNSDGVFEIITSLKPGKYYFLNRNTGTPAKYYIDGLNIKENGESTATDTKVYKIVLDFNSAVVDMVQVVKFELYFAPTDQILGELLYSGASKFTGTNIPVTFKQEGWGRDERYKFKMSIKSMGGADALVYYNSSNRDNQRATGSSPESYYYLWDNGDDSRWDYTFKFATEVDNKNIDVIADFSPSITHYTHKIIIK